MKYYIKWLNYIIPYSMYRYKYAVSSRTIPYIPNWITLKELIQIEQFYLSCPKGYCVHHILPLKGKSVTGLHTFYNLCYISKYKHKYIHSLINKYENSLLD